MLKIASIYVLFNDSKQDKDIVSQLDKVYLPPTESATHITIILKMVLLYHHEKSLFADTLDHAENIFNIILLCNKPLMIRDDPIFCNETIFVGNFQHALMQEVSLMFLLIWAL